MKFKVIDKDGNEELGHHFYWFEQNYCAGGKENHRGDRVVWLPTIQDIHNAGITCGTCEHLGPMINRIGPSFGKRQCSILLIHDPPNDFFCADHSKLANK